MPWRENRAIEERIRFVMEYESGRESLMGLCERYGVSRVTGYKWIERYEEEGIDGLWERSRAPFRIRHALGPRLVKRILWARQEHPTWGPRKLLAWLQVKYPQERWCVASTVGELLRRQGLSQPRVYRRRSAPRLEPLREYARNNSVWCTDFKGWFVLGNGERCEPWTLSDGHSRYLLRVQALAGPEMEAVWRGFRQAFAEYGLPEVIRSDNGRPFAGLGLGGLSKLSVWWIKLGIRPERISPGKPQENGWHERMHLTLKEAIEPPERTLKGQQRRFEGFRREFNRERPHESLGDKRPAEVYRPSARAYPKRVPQVEYDSGVMTKRVYAHGDIQWRGERLFLSDALGGEHVAFEPIDDGWWMIRFGAMKLGKLDERRRRIYDLKPEDMKR